MSKLHVVVIGERSTLFTGNNINLILIVISRLK